MVGEFPGLKDGLDEDGNVKATSDFRGVYASLLEQWLGSRRGSRHPGRRLVRAAGARPVIAAPPPPARVQVVAQEFRFALSRQTIKAGRAVVELRNMGEDAHDLVLRRVGGTRVLVRWPMTQPGAVVDREFRLQAGHLPPRLQRREPPRARHAGDARGAAVAAYLLR